MKKVCFLFVCLLMILKGCSGRLSIKERQFGDAAFQRKAEAEALEIAGMIGDEYKILKSDYYPPVWVVNFELSSGKEVYVTLDLYGNLRAKSELLDKDDSVIKVFRKKEISRREAVDIASRYIADIEDTTFTYADYHTASWVVKVFNTNNKKWSSSDWRDRHRLMFSVTLNENGFFDYPNWITPYCGDSDAVFD